MPKRAKYGAKVVKTLYERQIHSLLYERRAKSRDKEGVLHSLCESS
jgi:predicted nuclease of restriction endonuclease-like (RecB) superfamily